MTPLQELMENIIKNKRSIYEGDNLLASGVQLEAQSIEDDTIRFNVYIYNVQPGVKINYATGEFQVE